MKKLDQVLMSLLKRRKTDTWWVEETSRDLTEARQPGSNIHAAQKRKPIPTLPPNKGSSRLCLTSCVPSRPCHKRCLDRWRQTLRNESVSSRNWFVTHQHSQTWASEQDPANCWPHGALLPQISLCRGRSDPAFLGAEAQKHFS